MKRQPKAMTERTEDALAHAFWLNYIGDERYARLMLIHITNAVLKEGSNGTPKEIPFYK